jgi:radical SAM superfamily enzyme YgiQ (UPF0313 family)
VVVCSRFRNARNLWGPVLTDETLERVDVDRIEAGDVVGIGIHTANALRGYAIGKMARARGAYVVFGGIHATLYPNEAHELGGAHAVVKGDGDVVWSTVLADCYRGTPLLVYEGGRIDASDFLPARWDLVPRKSLDFASSPWPMTTSTRSLSPISASPNSRTIWRA